MKITQIIYVITSNFFSSLFPLVKFTEKISENCGGANIHVQFALQNIKVNTINKARVRGNAYI